MSNRVRVWDLPTRLFHWTLVACSLGLIFTGYRGGLLMLWHARLGYTVLTLLIFRVVWGFVGGKWSRFASFVYSPGSVINYLRGNPHPDHLIGHNPLGAGSVFAMLIFLSAQVATGMVGDDDAGFTGPLNKFVDNANVLSAMSYHRRIGQWVILGVILLHVAAVLFYLWKRKDNLINPMLHGDKQLPDSVTASRDDLASRVAALAVLGVCAGFVMWVVSLGG